MAGLKRKIPAVPERTLVLKKYSVIMLRMLSIKNYVEKIAPALALTARNARVTKIHHPWLFFHRCFNYGAFYEV